MATHRKTVLFFVGIIAVLIGLGCNSGCRHKEPRKVTLMHLLEKSNFVVFAHGRWRSDLELEVIANDGLTVRRDQQLKAAPPAGKIIDVVKFSQHPSASPESFVVFYRSADPAPEIVAMLPVYAGRIASILDAAGLEANVADLRKQLFESDVPSGPK